MAHAGDIDALVRLKQAAAVKVSTTPGLVKLLLAGGAGALLGAGAGSHLTHARDEEARARSKNTAFGAGVAAGLAGPPIVSRLNAYLNPASPGISGIPGLGEGAQ